MKIIEVNNNEVGSRIKNIRLTKGVTADEFGYEIGKKIDKETPKENAPSQSLVSRWERGVNLPNKERLKAIAELGDMSVNELLYGSVEDYRFSIINELFQINVLDKDMKESDRDIYNAIGGREIIDDVYEEVDKQGLGYGNDKQISRIFESIYNGRLQYYVNERMEERAEYNKERYTVNLNLPLEYFERIKKRKEYDQDNISQLEYPDEYKIPNIILDDEKLTDEEIKKINQTIKEIQDNK